MRVFTAVVGACAVILTASAATAQVSVSLNRSYQVRGGKMVVSVAVASGTRLLRPRFAAIRDGQPVPGGGSRAWIDFPVITSGQELTLRVPDEEGSWWLLLADDRTLVARILFDVVDGMTALEFKRRELEAAVPRASEPTREPDADTSRSQDAVESPDSVESYTQLMRLTSTQAIRPGNTVELAVVLPSSTNQSLRLSLHWIASTGSTLEEKERVAPLDHAGGTIEFNTAADGHQNVSTTAPSQNGTYDILLTYSGVLLDAMTVRVGR